jgi:hypothetical protein
MSARKKLRSIRPEPTPLSTTRVCPLRRSGAARWRVIESLDVENRRVGGARAECAGYCVSTRVLRTNPHSQRGGRPDMDGNENRPGLVALTCIWWSCRESKPQITQLSADERRVNTVRHGYLRVLTGVLLTYVNTKVG